jgi:hypothetical protein
LLHVAKATYIEQAGIIAIIAARAFWAGMMGAAIANHGIE